jgi:hypothetical protein
MKQEYKSVVIEFIEDDEKWKCTELGISSASLKDLKKRIDNHSKAQNKLNRFNALRHEQWQGWYEFTVTSFLPNGDFWTTRETKSGRAEREKMWGSSAPSSYVVSDVALKQIEIVKEKQAQIEEIEQEIEVILGGLETVEDKYNQFKTENKDETD